MDATPEILRYLDFVADRLDLRRSFTFDTRVESMTCDDDTSRWIVRADTGRTLAATHVVNAVGCLSAANVPPVCEDVAASDYERFLVSP